MENGFEAEYGVEHGVTTKLEGLPGLSSLVGMLSLPAGLEEELVDTAVDWLQEQLDKRRGEKEAQTDTPPTFRKKKGNAKNTQKKHKQN